MTRLVHSGKRPEEDIGHLRSRLAELDVALNERTTELSRLKTDLAAFRIRYRSEVGLLHDELDELERAIAEAELGELSKRLDEEAPRHSSSSASAFAAESAPRYSSDAIRRLFRDVAKAIHPDRASDEHTRGRRHTLMVEANRAYARGDEERLRRILLAWETSPEAVEGDDPEAARLRVLRRIGQIQEQLATVDDELADLRDSPLAKLKATVDEAAGRGKDLVADMVRRLQRDIMRARNRLDAMRWNP